MGKDSRDYEDFFKLFGVEPPPKDLVESLPITVGRLMAGQEDFVTQMVNGFETIRRLFKKNNSQILKKLGIIIERLNNLDQRVTDLEYEIFESDEDTTLD